MSTKKSSAQLITEIGYGEKSRNTHFLAKTSGIEDAKECIKIIDEYNDFNQKDMIKALDDYVNFPKFWSKDNPNNGSSLLEIHIGRESSPVMYIKLFKVHYLGSKDIYTDKNGKKKELTIEDFKKNMKLFRYETKADECDFTEDGNYITCRFWWD